MRLRLFDIIKYLKKQGFAIENSFIFYYSQMFSAFVNCSLDPIPKTIFLTEDDLELIDNAPALRIKVQKGPGKSYMDEDDDLIS